MLLHLQIFIGIVAAIFAILVATGGAVIMIISNFVRSWPDDWVGNFIGAAMLISIGFGVAEGFLALTRYVSGT